MTSRHLRGKNQSYFFTGREKVRFFLRPEGQVERISAALDKHSGVSPVFGFDAPTVQRSGRPNPSLTGRKKF